MTKSEFLANKKAEQESKKVATAAFMHESFGAPKIRFWSHRTHVTS